MKLYFKKEKKHEIPPNLEKTSTDKFTSLNLNDLKPGLRKHNKIPYCLVA